MNTETSRLTKLLADATRDLHELETRRAKLLIRIDAFKDAGALPLTVAPDTNGTALAVAATGKRRGKRKRAKPGALEAAIASILGSAKMTAKAVREGLEKSGYPHSLSGNNVSKTIASMVDKKVLATKPNGSHSTYWRTK